MAGQVYLSLLNPSIAFSFAGLVALLWRRWPSQTHLFPLSVSFLYLGIGFITHEWPLLSRPGSINYSSNALFFAAVVLACSSALVRARVGVPVLLFGLIIVIAVAGFAWFTVVTPSTLSRIYFLNGCFAVLALVTSSRLLQTGAHSLADRLFVAGVAMGGLLAAGRPLLMVTGVLKLNDSGELSQSAYWDSVLGLTPLLSVMVISLFVFALVLDLMTGLRREADQDYLTGLLNRRGFEIGAETRLAGSAGRHAAAALLVADIDDFKQINDRFGHAVGDKVIAAVGQVLAQHGQADLVGRTGGEEYALFYETGSRHTLETCAEAVRTAMTKLHLAGLPAGYRLTISIGLHLRDGIESLDDMMRRADRALYEAKSAGKNRAVLAPVRLRSV
ncbi:GGDEF domain-containing protein [Devosia aurantiaca]|uniref:diguanylate cyclase n=1 Tax=Devosia aurantiaca TaxID=2714858 RepID=A0A6M1SY46_9HYPH|nr:GGDEF domain-containing protein [Devosia aurantiaca]NGP19203.1 GGDEF domain-containing protein [Devosia aurantiaca]